MARPDSGTRQEPGARSKVPREILAEAAVWVTRLHGPDRSPQMERDFRAWQALSAVHREAFERCTDAWINVGKIKVSTVYESVVARSPTRRGAGRGGVRWWAAGAASTGVLTIAMLVGLQWWQLGNFSTDVGEQRTVMLDDGSRMLLNTDTRVRVSFSAKQRTVDVQGGEALFEVAKDSARPFVVRVSSSEVVAIGTAFAVRYGSPTASEHGALTVTLIEGQVSVRPAAGVDADGVAPPRPISMKAGDRLRLDQLSSAAGAPPPKVDRPNVDEVIAWKRSEAVFDATSLLDAVTEMNRYSRTPIVLVDGLAGAPMRVSGRYRTGDNVGFARAVAHLHGLRITFEAGRLELGKAH